MTSLQCFLNASLRSLYFVLGLSQLATSSLVRRCLKALQVFLPREASLHFLCQWYSCRNTLGSENLSPSQEWEQFVKCLLKQCGYHIDTLNVFEFSMRGTAAGCSPDTGSKKIRHNDHGSEDDWHLLLVRFFLNSFKFISVTTTILEKHVPILNV